MSPRAAARLESIGFEQVYDFTAGKAAWGAAGLPLEGENGSESRAGAHVRSDVPACSPSDRLQAESRETRPEPASPCAELGQGDYSGG